MKCKHAAHEKKSLNIRVNCMYIRYRNFNNWLSLLSQQLFAMQIVSLIHWD